MNLKKGQIYNLGQYVGIEHSMHMFKQSSGETLAYTLRNHHMKSISESNVTDKAMFNTFKMLHSMKKKACNCTKNPLH